LLYNSLLHSVEVCDLIKTGEWPLAGGSGGRVGGRRLSYTVGCRVLLLRPFHAPHLPPRSSKDKLKEKTNTELEPRAADHGVDNHKTALFHRDAHCSMTFYTQVRRP
jgi:hypothetical protein